ncbi:MAG: cytidine/deoxycytidylate deaminase family protein [Desulfovibrio sp.]|nr:cytidine/deoxycytidylate deaminase family protein [Desulfovibrio sp.]
MKRICWPEYFIKIAYLVAERSTCIRRAVGAIAVHDNRILATGYNGVPTGLKHCDVRGCLRAQLNIPSGQRHEICRGLHAEQNVIIQAATHGIVLKGAQLFSTTSPCVQCCKMLINCGFSAIFYAESYPDALAQEMLQEANIPFIQITHQNGTV